MKKRVKKKKKTAKKGKINLKYIIYFLLLVIFSLTAFITGIIYTQKNYEKELKKTQNSIKVLQEKIKKLKESKKTPLPVKTKAPSPAAIPSEIIDYKKSRLKTEEKKPEKQPKPPVPATAKTNNKPRLVIIIDDVSFKAQVKRIKAIPYKVTPSFFPPTDRHPNTPVYAKEFSHYMIHLPMQAIHFHKPEPNTLNINDSYQSILNRIKEVKSLFPKAEFVNNHTGSTFTSDKVAMVKLFEALKKEHMGFVDSKTTPNSQAKTAKKVCDIPLFTRNVFLDNEENSAYIRKQLKKAVNLAKKRGFAIAIGHPHTVTLETLKNSADLLKGVNVVYIDELKK